MCWWRRCRSSAPRWSPTCRASRDRSASLPTCSARRAAPDAIFVYLHEEENARFLKEARRQGIKVPLVGDTTLMDAQTIKLAGADANGVVGHAMLTPDAPIPAVQDFVRRFKDRYHVVPDHNAIQGYMAVWIVKAATDRMGKPDAAHLAETLHGLTIDPATEPGILMKTTILPNGDMDRQSFMVEVRDGHTSVIKVLPALGG